MSSAILSPSTNYGTPPSRGEPAWEVALLFPAQGSWTEDDYLVLDTNRLVEYSDGFLEVLPMPTIQHQMIVEHLHGLIADYVKSRGTGRVLFAPLPVRLWAGKFREPDIIYLRAERLRAARDYPHGADLVVEVVSEGEKSRERDLITKPAEYAKAGISEYWIVDPEERMIKVLVLDQGSYRLHGAFGPGEMATSVLLTGFQTRVAEVLAAGEDAFQGRDMTH
jgi:Uma2 family endonuclease